MNLFDNQRPATRAFLVCLALVAVCYTNAIANAFILDDVVIVAANEKIRHIEPVQFLSQPYWGHVQGFYRPLTIFTYSLEYPLWKVWAPGYRITNLLLHAVNGWLVFLLARSLLGSPAAALASAVVYVAHPAQTEAVVSLVGRSELLAAGLFFAAWLAFRNRRIWLSGLAYFLALLSKESAITFPAVALLDVALTSAVPSDETGWPDETGWRGRLRAAFGNVRRQWQGLAVLAGTAIGYLALRAHVLGGLGVPATWQYLHGTLSIFQRWITSGRVFLQYFGLLLAPVNLASDYDFNSIPIAGLFSWDAWMGLALVAAAIILAVIFANRRPAASLAVLFFFVALIPVSNWIMPTALLMAERFLYTPIFGFALLAGLAWASVEQQSMRRILAGGFVVTAVLLCISHNYIWQDTLTFHRNAVRVEPNNARARLGYGFALLHFDKIPEAREQFEAGLRILPESAPLLAGLASATMQLDGNCRRVRPLLERALASDPGQWHSLWVLGDCFLMEGNRVKAEKSYELAIQDSDFPDAKLLYSWASLLEAEGKFQQAIAAYERAELIDPTDDVIKMRLRLLKQSHPSTD